MSPSVHVIDMVTNEKYYTQFQNAENNYVLISLYSVSVIQPESEAGV